MFETTCPELTRCQRCLKKKMSFFPKNFENDSDYFNEASRVFQDYESFFKIT